jgi:hypothetical protein
MEGIRPNAPLATGYLAYLIKNKLVPLEGRVIYIILSSKFI